MSTDDCGRYTDDSEHRCEPVEDSVFDEKPWSSVLSAALMMIPCRKAFHIK
jgi:hypothetical protein